MANDARVPGKKGALPRDPDRYVPVLEHYLRPWEGPVAANRHQNFPLATLPPASGDIDRETLVSDWPMYVNGPDPANPPYAPDGLGDCTIAGAAHFFAAMRVYAGYSEPEFSSGVIVDTYSACGGYVKGDPSTDQGCDPAQVLRHLHTAGMASEDGTTHKVAGYAAFGNPRNIPLMAQVLNTFGTVYVAVDLPESAETQFSDGAPWSYVPGSPSVGGHMIVLQRRRTGGVGVLEVPTWGAVQRATKGFMWHTVRDAFCVVSADWITANGTTPQGLDLEQLLDDMREVE